MALFRKNRRNVGEFVAPEPQPLAPLDDVIHDALKIAAHGVRMAVKNHLIVNALRDGKSFDEQELEDFARNEYHLLAVDNREAAERAEHQLKRDADAMDGRVYPGGKPVVVDEDHQRKPLILRSVADAYEGEAVEPAALAVLIDDAKAEAWAEIGAVVSARLAQPRVEDDPEYLTFRDERLAHFVDEDLAELIRNSPEAQALAEADADAD
ncbi:hypothetical protein ACFOYW_11720 [Gryllotalpicola reticulitermitis]|uniref:Uncharacterized protein n=1 Tax=Gryllotalpicola reticulitermitis TaxID=1184153 RepID=A0ABV8Q9N1_9MICO